MGSPCPPHWSFAARAAYFGDRLCGFCEHRNPPGANFCNDCAAPLNLKPCRQCDGINDQSASHCHKCGAAILAGPATFEPSAAAGTTPGDPPPGQPGAAPLAMDATPATASNAGRRVQGPARIVVATAVAVGLMAGAHQAFRPPVVKPVVMDVASPSAAPVAPDASSAVPIEAVVAESSPPPTEEPADVEIGGPAADPDATQRVATRRAPAPAVAKERPSGRQRAAPARHPPAGRTATVAQRPAAPRANAAGAKSGKARPPDRWGLMQASLAGCGGDLVARVVCDQQVRRRFCEGHWGAAAECRSGVVNEHGQ